ncbi:hypothetical protein AAC387_Pa12g1603 [Persea americana]
MAGNPERVIEQALIALKKGTQLIKYSRKGKPKFCPFRVSADETTLIWYSHGEERNLKLASVLRIVPGQRTAVFRRYLCPEKDYLSFSLIYNNGYRSLDLICKDKTEADLWFAGLKVLISPGQRKNLKFDGGSDDGGGLIQDVRRLNSTPEIRSSISHGRIDPPLNLARSDVGSDWANMHPRSSISDGSRISVSSIAPSFSSLGSGPDDCESLGDVYVWGEVWCDGTLADGSVNLFSSKSDALLPKAIESNVVLDVHQIACGVRHAALVTRQGEIFTWGEESGGRLGHGIDRVFSRPQLVDFLALRNMDFVACGEHHTCAVSTTGDLYSWGDGSYNAGFLGHGTDVSHWIPKRVCGSLEGLQIVSVACGTWHSALVTSNGKLFTFGDGTFGVLGHGDRENVAYPREVESLRGLKTVKVACGVWHTAAIVEVIGQQGGNNFSRKLFTWGDANKSCLGHGDKEPRLLPTCVSSLIDYNFHQLACGHSITVALATTGRVVTMGSTTHGQLGNPRSDGKVPCFIQGKLVDEFVDEISCGAYHVAVLTAKSEVFTWGKGANGRLGHGDVEDRKIPTLVEALRDRHVKSISCGSNFTASICIHKWVSGADQSVCSGCRQAFGFTRKRHNCYNCGLVHCHGCSSKKVLKAALAPTTGKPHRVCDSCYTKLKASESISAPSVKKTVLPRRSIDNREKFDRGEIRSSKVLLHPNKIEASKYLEVKTGKQGATPDLFSIRPQVPTLSHLKESSLNVLQHALKPIVTSPPSQPTLTSKPASPYSRRSSPPRSTSPVFSRGIVDSLKKTNDLLNQEVLKLQAQVKSLRVEMQKSENKAKEAALVASEECSKCNTAKELLKSLTGEMNNMADKLAPEVYDVNHSRELNAQVEALLKNGGNRASEWTANIQDQRMDDFSDGANEGIVQHGNGDFREANQIRENDSRSPKTSAVRFSDEGGENLTEQFEPGVYVTLVQLPNGTKVFKRVRFSKRKFEGKQAEEWWRENKQRVLKKYSYPGIDNAVSSSNA